MIWMSEVNQIMSDHGCKYCLKITALSLYFCLSYEKDSITIMFSNVAFGSKPKGKSCQFYK